MIANPSFEIVKFAEDHMAVPVGKEATTFHGVVALSEPAAYILKLLKEPMTPEELIDKLLEHYELDRSVAEKDLNALLPKLREMNLIFET